MSPVPVTAYLWKTLPLAAFAGVRIMRLDERPARCGCPGGWRTRNPFRSTYFAAQAMAAEMSTGAPAMVLVRDAPASMAILVVEIRGVRQKGGRREPLHLRRRGRHARGGGGAPRGGRAQAFTGHATGRDAKGTVVAEFEITGRSSAARHGRERTRAPAVGLAVCGGRSRGWADRQGAAPVARHATLLDHTLDRLRLRAPDVALLSGPSIRYADRGFPVVADTALDGGPGAGLAPASPAPAAERCCSSRWTCPSCR